MSKHTGSGNKKISTWIKISITFILVIALGFYAWFTLMERSDKQKEQVANSCISGRQIVNVGITNNLKPYLTPLINEYNAKNEKIRDKCVQVVPNYNSSKNLFLMANSKNNKNEVILPAGLYWNTMLETNHRYKNKIKDYYPMYDSLAIVLPKTVYKAFEKANYSWETYLRMASEKFDFSKLIPNSNLNVQLNLQNNITLLNEINYSIYKMTKQALQGKLVTDRAMRAYFIRPNKMAKEKNITDFFNRIENSANNNKLVYGAVTYLSDFYQYKTSHPNSQLMLLTTKIDSMQTQFPVIKLADNSDLTIMESIDSFINFYLDQAPSLKKYGYVPLPESKNIKDTTITPLQASILTKNLW